MHMGIVAETAAVPLFPYGGEMRKLLTGMTIAGLLVAPIFTPSANAQSAAPMPEELSYRLEDKRDSCSAAGGTLEGEDKALTAVELSAETGATLWVYEEANLRCSAGLDESFCGSGGCYVSFFTGTDELAVLIHSWRVYVEKGVPILETITKGDDCGSAKSNTCAVWYIWQNGELTLSGSELKQ